MTRNRPLDPPGAPLACVREQLVASLSLAPDSSSAHTVAAYQDGLRFTLVRYDTHTPIYTYALPWARGWTVFVSSRDNQSNYDWHHCDGYSQRVSNDRWLVGPENVSIPRLINAIYEAIDYMDFHYSRPDGYDDTPYDPDGAIDQDAQDEIDDNNGSSVIFNGQP